MPLHTFTCKKCGKRHERLFKTVTGFEESYKKGELKCDCGGELVKDVHAPNVHFKGADWESNSHMKETFFSSGMDEFKHDSPNYRDYE